MKVRLGALSAVLVLFAGCKTPEKPPPPAAPPVIKTFTVSKDRISKGEMVTFAFTTERAKSVSLVDQAGTEISTSFDATAGSGSASASPASSSFFVLRADGETGRDSAFVQVAVDEGLKSVFLVVVPQEVKAGESVDLLWSAPGGRNVTVVAGTRTVGMGESGTAQDTPATTTSYRLTAGKLDGTNLTADATVKVQPVINEFSSAPPVARAGQKITVSWKTAGAESVELTEATFGALTSTSTAMDVAQGSFEFTVPYYFGDAGVPDPDAGVSDAGVADGGLGVPPVRDGFPLRFVLTAKTATPAQSVSRAIDGRVGAGPIIDSFDVPANATQNRPQTISWETTNVTRVELYADGLLVFAPRAGVSVDGRYTLPSINADTTFRLVAYDFTGLSVSKTATCKPVRPPQITTFTAPATVATGSSPVMASWVTRDATRVIVRLKNGPAVFYSETQSEVTMGSTTLYAGTSLTFVLEAYNAAGDLATAERTVRVTTPVTIGFTPNPSSGTVPITANWDVSSLAAVDLPGLANSPPQSMMSSTAFIDLETVPAATALTFTSRDNGSATFTAPSGFTFPFVTTMARTFTASTNGVLGLGSVGAGNTNLDLGSTMYAGPAPLLAPFWDDLDLAADGNVKWFLDGTQFPRKLIVQWTKVQIAGTSGTELTFQVQLFETGKFFFVYKTMTGTNADGASATIGAIESLNTFYGRVSHNTAGAVATGQELLWFGNDATRAIGSATLRLSRSVQLGFFAETGTGSFIPVFGTPRIIGANAVLVNEAMPVPSTSVAEGRWVELYNPGNDTVDLSDLEVVSSSGAMSPYVVPTGTTIDGGAFLVIGDSTDMLNNGGAPVASTWGMGYSLLDADDLSLRIPGMTPFTVSRLAWTAGPPDGGTTSAPGVSVQAAERAITSTGAALNCTRAQMFGNAMQVGSPGVTNETCFEYRLEPILVAYEDISSSGTVVFSSGSLDTQTVSLDLPAPFTYFGTPQSRVAICTNGWLAFGTQTSTTGFNRTSPSATSQPVGAVAVLWDDLTSNTTFPGANVYLARLGNRTIVQWHHSSYWTPLSDDMNFQVKLFDNGVIEFHYGTMTNNPTGTQRYAEGASATVWLERPTGTAAALPIVRNSGVSTATTFIAPNTAFRFTPR